MEDKKKMEVEIDINMAGKLTGLFYLVHNLRERFELTKTEDDAMDYVLHLLDRERKFYEDGDFPEPDDEDEEGEVRDMGIPMPRTPNLAPGAMVEVGGYA